MESALLHKFSRGTIFEKIAPLVFQDTLRGTVRYLVLGAHLSIPKELRVGDIIAPQRTGHLPSLGLNIARDDIIWFPPGLTEETLNAPALAYSTLVGFFLRVNTASHIMGEYRRKVNKGTVPKTEWALVQKIKNFIDGHLKVARLIDDSDPNSFSDETIAKLNVNVPSLGVSRYMEDRDLIKTERRRVKVADTPLEVLGYYDIAGRYQDMKEFGMESIEKGLGYLADRIRRRSDHELARLYVGADQEAFDYYNPIEMADPEQCRAHSWYLACVTMINKCWGEISAKKKASEEEERIRRQKIVISTSKTTESLEEDYKHPARVRHAFHCIMGGFVQLLYHCILRPDQISDNAWRPQPDGRPTMLDKYFPEDTVCFYGGDLPNVGMVLEQVGLYGVQDVKKKIPLVTMLMKSLPVCCQSRDLIKTFIKECKNANGEGYWRVVRLIMWTTLCGLYPKCFHRTDFRGMMQIYQMLFVHKDIFFTSLEAETVANSKKKKEDRTNDTCMVVYTAFREFFIYSCEDSPEWIAVINQRINWKEFVANTCNMADTMRDKARLADTPKEDVFKNAIAALKTAKGKYGDDVYRYQKKEYIPMISEKLNKTQDNLNTRKRLELEEMKVIQTLWDKLLSGGIIDEEDVAPIVRSRHVDKFGFDPLALYRESSDKFVDAIGAALTEAQEWHSVLKATLPTEIKVNIVNFLLRTKPSEWNRWDCLLDVRLGGIGREAVQLIGKTQLIHNTRSSPKSITEHVLTMDPWDIRVFSWYFNVISRLEKFSLSPLTAGIVNRQIAAFRKHRFHLLDEEPLPRGAWVVYVSFCCGRLSTFVDTNIYGNFGMSYDPWTRNMVCAKKVPRTSRARVKTEDAVSILDTEIERRKKEDDARTKKARTERREETHIPCEDQPMIPIDLFGMALEFGGDRYLHCPECAQFHMYRDSGWGRGGYMCKMCRDKENPPKKLQRCAFCEGGDKGGDLKVVDVIVLDRDPAKPLEIDPDEDYEEQILRAKLEKQQDPLSCYQTIHLCSKHANSAGVFAKHSNERHFINKTKEELWEMIGPATSARAIKNERKFN